MTRRMKIMVGIGGGLVAGYFVIKYLIPQETKKDFVGKYIEPIVATVKQNTGVTIPAGLFPNSTVSMDPTTGLMTFTPIATR